MTGLRPPPHDWMKEPDKEYWPTPRPLLIAIFGVQLVFAGLLTYIATVIS